MDLILERTRLILQRFHWVVNLLMIALLARQFSGIIITFIDSKLPAPSLVSPGEVSVPSAARKGTSSTGPRSNYDVVVERNIFNSAPKPVAGADTPAVPTSDLLNKIRLTGTVVSKKRTLATFFIVPKNESEVFTTGEEVYEGWVLESIERAVAVLKSGNEVQEVPLYDAEAPNKPVASKSSESGGTGEAVPLVAGAPSEGFAKEEGDGKYIVDKAELNSQLENLDQLITQARVIPNYTQGKVDGFKIFAIKPNSIFQRLGFRNGDIIEAVNGTPLDNPAKGLQLFQELRNLPRFEINMRRHSNKRTHSYEVR